MKPLSFLLTFSFILSILSAPILAQNRGGFTSPSTSRQAGARPVGSSQSDLTIPRDVAAVRVGIRGGVTYPIFLENQGADPSIGYVGGIVAQFGRGNVSFQPEVNYSQFGFNTSIPFLGSINARFTQIEVPLLLKFSSGQATGHRFFFNVGPYGSYLYRATSNGIEQDLDNVLDTRFSVGAAAGLGAAFKAGPGHLTVEVRGLYTLGTTEEINTDSRLIELQGTLGYLIPLGGR
ncbi:hypothetical protein BN8_00793 [Fibrisoma limi BUZ 3]|uniref:Outer membrane protein beta-barrel domain-containing protein n=1 Tax=Fibrisoma limi BUZ 3 TaxID=1185876 RepID=I2GD67_9BACT|nr:porin family protein [Fibrisoma limi]CCH51841.1 hypothetical protein BN8_00793 [Fibrisoma limi BUZ 3]